MCIVYAVLRVPEYTAANAKGRLEMRTIQTCIHICIIDNMHTLYIILLIVAGFHRSMNVSIYRLNLMVLKIIFFIHLIANEVRSRIILSTAFMMWSMHI